MKILSNISIAGSNAAPVAGGRNSIAAGDVDDCSTEPRDVPARSASAYRNTLDVDEAAGVVHPLRPGIGRGPQSVSMIAKASGVRAFSLIEIMVAVSLLTVIILGLLAMFYQVQRAFRAGTAQADIMEGGRATMAILTRDLQVMTASDLELITNCVVTASAGAAEAFQDIPTGSQRTNFFQNISFLSRDNDEWIGTSYRISNAVNGVGVLYRFVTNRFRETLPQLNDVMLRELSDAVSFQTVLGDPRYSRVIDGVAGLRITPVFTNGIAYFNNDPRLIPAVTGTDTFGNRYTNASLHVIKPDFYGFRSNDLPAYVDVELTILEPSTLAKFRAREEIGQAEALEYLKRQVGRTHVFRQRVAIRPATAQLHSLTFN